MSKLTEKIENFRYFVGPKVEKLFLLSVFVGVFWFLVESSFVFVIQGFLLSLGLLEESKLMLPSWYPRDFSGCVGFLVGLGFLRAFMMTLKNYVAETTNQSFIRHQRSIILNHALNYAHRDPPHVVTTLFSERMSQAGGILFQTTVIINSAIAFLLFLAYGLKLAPRELLLGLCLLGFLFLPFRQMDKKIRESSKNIVQIWDGISKILLVGMKNFFYLKLFSLIDAEVKKGLSSLQRFEKINKNFYFLSAIRYGYPQFAGILTISFMTFMGVVYFQTPGVVLLSLFYLFLRIVQSASEINVSLGHIRYSMEGFKILYRWYIKAVEELHILEKKEKDIQHRKLSEGPIHIHIKNLSFAFEDGPNLLEDVKCQIGPGEVLLIQGPSGSGKSTLVSLILGLLSPNKGEVLINEQEVLSVKKSLLEKVAYVGPEPYLISGTLRENLLYGHPNPSQITDQMLWQALEKAAISEVVKRLPKGLDEELYESAQISTGQKQRLAVARALIRQAKVLILDEATANLDADTESKLIQTFQSLRHGITTIVVSHRNSFNDMATQRIVLGQERV